MIEQHHLMAVLLNEFEMASLKYYWQYCNRAFEVMTIIVSCYRKRLGGYVTKS